MTNITTTARPYAKAAFESAKSTNQLSMWSLALKKLTLVVQDAEVSALLKNPHYTKKRMEEFFIELLSGEKSIHNFIRLLADKKRLPLLPTISVLFESYSAQESGYLTLAVISAFAMSEAQKNNTTEKLSKRLNSKCEIDFKVDEKLIGGLLVRSDNWVMDGTIKGKLERLKSVLV